MSAALRQPPIYEIPFTERYGDHDCYPVLPVLEPEYYLPKYDYGFFSVLEKRKDGTSKQRSYQLNGLAQVLEGCDDRSSDYWVSQACFSAPNRRKVNLRSIGQCFVDIDCYNVHKFRMMEPEQVLFDYVLPVLDHHKLPFPSVSLYSGRGLQLKWLHENLPAKALPRWDLVQRYLTSLLTGIGADKNARDASRVLRLNGTINQKSGSWVEVIHIEKGVDGQPCKYVFDDICNKLLPYTREELNSKRELLTERKKTFTYKKTTSGADVVKMLSHKHSMTLESLNWYRFQDLRKIVSLRGGMEPGMREMMAFYQCNFFALRYAMSRTEDHMIWHEFKQIFKAVAPHYTDVNGVISTVYDKMKRTAQGELAEWNGREVPLLYIPRNNTLIDLFGITSDEMRSMTTVIDSKEKLRRKAAVNADQRREAGMRARGDYVLDVAVEADKRMQRVLMLTSQGYKQSEIAGLMDITINAVKALKKRALKARI